MGDIRRENEWKNQPTITRELRQKTDTHLPLNSNPTLASQIIFEKIFLLYLWEIILVFNLQKPLVGMLSVGIE
jgi:hypothetical protein